MSKKAAGTVFAAWAHALFRRSEGYMPFRKITKSVLVDAVRQNVSEDRAVIQRIVDSFLDELRDAMADGCTVELRGFGTFEPRLRKGRSEARNPKTGEIVSVEPHYVAAFRAGRFLRNEMWRLGGGGAPEDGTETD